MARRYYDLGLNDDTCHGRVLAAREAGRDWAEREWDALTAEEAAEQRGQAWYPTPVDALPLVRFDPDEEIEDQDARERELAEACNDAAAARWDVLAAEDEDEEDEDEDEDGRCEVAQWRGNAPCEAAATVVVEYMPEQERDSHEAAGGGGCWPHNGAVRLAVCADCANDIVEIEGAWAEILAGDVAHDSTKISL